MKKNETIPRDAPLENAALTNHLRAVASECRKTGMARLGNMRHAIGQLEISLAKLRVRGDSHELTPAAVWLSDNARVIEEACISVREELRHVPRIPAYHGEARIARLVREWLSHTNARATGDSLIQATAAWQQTHPLTEMELCLLPLATRRALMLLLSNLAVQCAKIEQERTRAEATAYIDPKTMSDAYWERLSCLLLEQEDLEALERLDARLARQGTSAAEIAEREHERQTRACLWTSNAIASLRAISSLDFRNGLETLSSIDRWLRNDPTKIYARMDFASRSMYRQRAAKLAKSFRVAESTVARKAIACAEAALDDTIPDLSRHVGYYLMDEGQPLLWESLGKAPFSLRAFRAIGKWASLLYIGMIFLGSTAVTILLWLLGIKGWLVAPALLVAGEGFRQLAGLFIHRLSPPRRMARLAPDQLDDGEVLVVVPTLLTSRTQALEMVRHLSVLRLANPEKRLSYMLLGDFKDGPSAMEPQDQEITEAALSAISALNEVWNGGFYYLHRARTWNKAAGKFMGHERKRGALVSLNEILLRGHSGAQIEASSCAPVELSNRFDYVITLDADTQLPPGSALMLAGMLQHPLNHPCHVKGKRRGCAILQPRMETASSTVHTRIARIWGGDGGFDPYITAFSDIYQNLCGEGSFAGKGIYHVQAFEASTAGKILDNTILSHDLLEGGLCGSSLVCDLALYDSQPASLSSWMKRLHRWTRGDWQLLPWLIPFVRGKDGWFKNPLSMLSQYKIYDNLRRSLVPLASIVLLVGSVWKGESAAFATGLLIPHLRALMPPSKKSLLAAVTHLSMVPYEAANLADAILRTLYRIFISKKKLLEWVPAAEAEKHTSPNSPAQFWPNFVSAGALLAAAFTNPIWLLAALPLGALWAIAPLTNRWLNAKEKPPAAISDEHKRLLLDIARRTFAFFEETVTPETNHLPPDNLQIEPAIGITPRTSPTNIGMYLLACVSACELDILDADSMALRIENTIGTLERMEKWYGHLYNWYDVHTLTPLSNKYISSVDSGNLAGCLLLTAQALRSRLGEIDASLRSLSSRVDALAAAMEFSMLYDDKKDLFTIGVHAETGARDESHYDLLASESRLLSYIALMRREVPLRHWRSMGRAMTKTQKGAALLSWSGTMFEYLLPSIFLKSPHGTLLGDTCMYAALEQTNAFGEMPWGVSESGYYAFDRSLSYQYRAFGLPRLALKTANMEQVITPYASALSLEWLPEASIQNLVKMVEMGWLGALGFYEAADYNSDRIPEGYAYKLIQSHMAHHQGMILASICNLLTGGLLSDHFHSLPQVEAYALLLEEKKPTRSMLRATRKVHRMSLSQNPRRSLARSASTDYFPFDVQALYGGGTTMVIDARGSGYISHNGLLLTRHRADPLYDNGIQIYVRLEDGKLVAVNRQCSPVFDRSRAIFRHVADGLEITLTCFVSPLDGSAIHMLRLHALPDRTHRIEIASFMEVCLSTQTADESHPAFRNLSVETKRLSPEAGIAWRRSKKEERVPMLLHAVNGDSIGDVSLETSRAAFLGRGTRLDAPLAMRTPMRAVDGETGAVLDPCMSLRAAVEIEAGQTVTCWFLTAAIADEDKARALIAQYASYDPVNRALELAITQDDVTAAYLGLEPAAQLTALRMASWLIAPLAQRQAPDQNRNMLWQFAISGDLPVIAVRISHEKQLPLVRATIKAHAYLRAIGIWSDLVLINEQHEGYFQPLRDALHALLAGGPSRTLIGQGGGLYLLDANLQNKEAVASLYSHAALVLHGSAGSLAAQIVKLRRALPVFYERWLDGQPWPAPQKPYAGTLALENGFGGFRADGGYVQHTMSPMPWCNVLANDILGTILSDRGTGFTYAENSRMRRITAFASDPVRDHRSEDLYLRDENTGHFASPLDHALVTHGFGFSRFESNLLGIVAKLDIFVDAEHPVKCMLLELYNPAEESRELSVTSCVRFLLGSHMQDAAQVHCEIYGNTVFASSPVFVEPVYLSMPGRDAEASFDGAGFFGAGGMEDPRGMHAKHLESACNDVPSGILRTRLTLGEKETQTICILLGTGDHSAIVRSYQEGGAQLRLAHVKITWQLRQKALRPLVPDPAFAVLIGGWLPYQALSSRIFAHAGFYQAGGAIGFRDQLQDMLAFIHTEPQKVRAHLLDAAAHQFEDGDVQHWWHPPAIGVRTRITDDRIFLPYLCAAYLRSTQDTSILEEEIPYLRNENIPAGQEDWYGEAQTGDIVETLHLHNLRAIQSVQYGAHGIPLIGSGDWNDGLNTVGIHGRGESIWLGFFLAKVMSDYAEFCSPEEAESLLAQKRSIMDAIETHAWDGAWYMRAWFDDGGKLGSASNEECKIDLVVQAWAALAGAKHAKQAFLSAMSRLVDREAGILKLLDPPFDGHLEPGYIRTYPPGIRENGGQYTHAACWFVLACVKLGMIELAWELFTMLLPTTHSRDAAAAARYRVEPYVISADIAAGAHPGQGGWTWYTGSASLLYVVAMEHLLGFQKRGNRIRLKPTAPTAWVGYTVEYRYGATTYVLRAARGGEDAGWIELADDGLIHEAVYALPEPEIES